jgi:TPR repeat protein
MLEHARELMERASRALDDAAKLAPEDTRVAAEAGAVLARYLQRDPERARSFLEKAVLLGEAEVRALAANADEQGRLRLEEAQTRVGDACLDLGTLHLSLLGDPARAIEWLEKSRKAGPDPRPEIDKLLERCRAALAGQIDPRLRDEDRWAAPIQPGKGT